jgi:tetratricopeptide (TPR) repeat protein
MIQQLQKTAICLIIVTLYGCGATYQYLQERRDRNYEEGVKNYKQKKYKEARDNFDTVVSTDPGYKNAMQYLKKTEAILKQKEKDSNKSLADHYSKAMKYKKAKKYEDALIVFLKINELDPSYKDNEDQIEFCRGKLAGKYKATVGNAENLYKKSKYRESYTLCLKAKLYNPKGPEADKLMSKIQDHFDEATEKKRKIATEYYEKKDYRSAKDELVSLLKINPWDQEGIKMLQDCNRKIAVDDEYNSAVKDYIRQKHFQALARFYEISKKEKGYKDADRYIEDINSILSRSIPEFYNRGVQYYENGKYKEAINSWNMVLTIDPNHEKAREYKKRAQAKLSIKESLTDE